MKTLADDQVWLRERLAYPDRHTDAAPLPRWARALAPCCGAECAADSVLDLRWCAGTIFRAAHRHAELDHDAACTGCLWILLNVSHSGWTLSRIARVHGAATETVRHLRATEVRDDAESHARKENRPFDPNLEFERALSALPIGSDQLPGTDPPDPSARVRAR
jgi:hypothetical protein